MNILAKSQAAQARNLYINLFLCVVAAIAAAVSWWAATHPSVVVVSVPPAATQPLGNR